MGYYITYDTVDQFAADTVHSYTAHNAPHDKLIQNDADLDAQLYAVSSTVAGITIPSHSIVWVTPYQVYSFASAALTLDTGLPSEFFFSGATNTGHAGAWQTVAYPSTSYIPASGVASILVSAALRTGSSQQAYIRICATAAGGGVQVLSAYSSSRNNSDDAASSINTIEMPFNASRQLSILWNKATASTYWGWVTVVGYRTST